MVVQAIISSNQDSLFTNFCKTFPTSLFQCVPLNDYVTQSVLTGLTTETLPVNICNLTITYHHIIREYNLLPDIASPVNLCEPDNIAGRGNL